jgi:hypothetical protein
MKYTLEEEQELKSVIYTLLIQKKQLDETQLTYLLDTMYLHPDWWAKAQRLI